MRVLCWLLLVALIAACICGPVGDPDLWWHVVVGRWIYANGSVPHTDLWNSLAAGTPWRAYSWSNELVYAVVERSYGGYGLLCLKLLLALLFSGALSYCAGRIAGSWSLGIFLGAAAAIGCYAHFGLRPQVLSWVCFALTLYFAECMLRHGICLRRLLSLMAVMVLWANTHISTVLGIAALLIWVLDFTEPKKGIRLAGILVGASFAATLLTPYLGGEWITVLGKAEHPFAHMYIREFQPASLYHAGANITVLLFSVLIVLIHKNPRILSASQLCGAVIFLFAGLTIQKFLPFAAIYTSFLIARLWHLASDPAEEFGNLGNAISLGLEKLSRTPRWCFGIVCLLAGLFSYGTIRPLLAAPIDTRSVAVEPLDFIQNHQLSAPILNTFNDGGYVLFRYSDPEGVAALQVALDGRTNVNTPEATSAFLAALHGKTNWTAYLDLVKPETILWDNNFSLVSLLLLSEEWCHVFPRAESPILSSRWSVFIKAAEFKARAAEFSSRDCIAPVPESISNNA